VSPWQRWAHGWPIFAVVCDQCQRKRHTRDDGAATVGTATAGTELVTQAEVLREQVEHTENDTCQGPWGMIGIRVITAVELNRSALKTLLPSPRSSTEWLWSSIALSSTGPDHGTGHVGPLRATPRLAVVD